MSRTLTYVGIFLVAMTTLALEVLLTRLVSVAAWYHLAFFVISLAMLGMTAGAVAVFLWPQGFSPERLPARLAQGCLAFALAIPVAVGVALSMPLLPVTDLMTFFGLLSGGCVLALPFVPAGIVLTLALTRAGLPAGTAYGVDLCGAAVGCVVAVPLLNGFDGPSAALVVAAVAAVGAGVFARAAGARGLGSAAAAVVLLAAALANAAATPPPLRPVWVKGEREDAAAYLFVGWNTHSRVTVGPTLAVPPTFWGAGRQVPVTALAPLPQRVIEIDGAAATLMAGGAAELARHDYLQWDVTAFAHRLRPGGAAAVVGVGGGRDVLEAARVGHAPVVGIELNELILRMHRQDMADFSGLAQIPGVELVADEARSYLARDERRYAVLTMSLIDTWASSGAGAYSLSENGLYTADAWELFLSRLTDDGIFTVSRWYKVDSPGETARMLALGMEALWRLGVADPRAHLVLLQSGPVATLLVARSPLSAADVDTVQREAVRLGVNMVLTPRKLPVHPMLRDLMAQPSRDAMWAWTGAQTLDLTPPTDARPFFFNMLKLASWWRDPTAAQSMDFSFLGNLQATQTLFWAIVVSAVLTGLTVGAPLIARRAALRRVPRGLLAASLGYFGLIGLGFMLVEIGLLSRLTVFLGHPTLALAVLLGGMVLATGCGSLLSGRFSLADRRIAVGYPLGIAALVGLCAWAQGPVLQLCSGATVPARIAVSLALLWPAAMAMGLGFPLGLRLAGAAVARTAGDAVDLGPWLWGQNGACGVLASGGALAISMAWGVPATLIAGATCYLLLPLAISRFLREGLAAGGKTS